MSNAAQHNYLGDIVLNYLPLMVAVVSIFGAALIYGYQKSVDRKTSLMEMRRHVYREFLKAFSGMTNAPENIEQITREFYQSEFDLIAVGSDDVIRRVGELTNFYSETNHDRHNRDAQEVKKRVAAVCQAMRADCFEKSSLTDEEITALIPIAGNSQ